MLSLIPRYMYTSILLFISSYFLILWDIDHTFQGHAPHFSVWILTLRSQIGAKELKRMDVKEEEKTNTLRLVSVLARNFDTETHTMTGGLGKWQWNTYQSATSIYCFFMAEKFQKKLQNQQTRTRKNCMLRF